MYRVRGGVTHSCELEPIHLVQILFPCPNFTPILNLECLYNRRCYTLSNPVNPTTPSE